MSLRRLELRTPAWLSIDIPIRITFCLSFISQQNAVLYLAELQAHLDLVELVHLKVLRL